MVWAAFPNKSGSQVVGRLLTTARSLDGAQISSRYGHGALDLEAALNPVGFLSVPMNEGGNGPAGRHVHRSPARLRRTRRNKRA